MDAKKEIKKAKKELEKLQKKTDALQEERTSLQERLDGLESERKKLIEIQALQGGVQDNLDSIRVEIIQGRERIAEVDEILAVLRARRDELKQEANELEAQIVEAIRRRFRLEFEDKLESLAKEFKELWPIAQAGNRFLIPEHFAQQISRLALGAATKAGELAGDELLKREVAKMT